MILSVSIRDKWIGQSHLFSGLTLSVGENEKVALIGRNGAGKSTLFRILSGEEDFDGEIVRKKGVSLAFTLQEHYAVQDVPVIDYVLNALPDYVKLQSEISMEEHGHGGTAQTAREYSDPRRKFAELGYFGIRDRIISQLAAYQIPESRCLDTFSSLSGGEKRYVDMVKVMFSQADLLCLDEPTNHMDYEGKSAFIDWLRGTRKSVLVITHDRDVLEVVDRIVELKDRKAESSKGNYGAYLKRNKDTTVVRITQHEEALRKKELLEKSILSARAKKASNPRARHQEERLVKEYESLEATLQKPSFWIDAESGSQLDNKSREKYLKYKDKTIRISGNGGVERHSRNLLSVENLKLGYGIPLLQGLHFSVHSGNRVLLKGRNGAGKTTLINTILSEYDGLSPDATIYSGGVHIDEKLKIGVYEQELDPRYLNMTAGQAVADKYAQNGTNLSNEQLYRIMSEFLFDPVHDSDLPVGLLSGGEKARIQIICMFANSPDLLVLDEPTNHLDLPSIEELERALLSFSGAILYVSHDSFFNRKISDRVIELERFRSAK